MKIFDCFTFFNELDLLEFRLKLLDEQVDFFVIAESNLTHSGMPKTYLFDEHKDRFAKWLPKIVYLKISQSTNGLTFDPDQKKYNPLNGSWSLETGQRSGLREAAQLMANDDIVIVGDLDEIPDPVMLKKIKPQQLPLSVSMLFHNYYMNYQYKKKERWWNGSVLCTGSQFKENDPQIFRDNRNRYKRIKKGGWHFSYLGGYEKIKQKLLSFAHTEYSSADFTEDQYIITALEKGKDVLKRPGIEYTLAPLDEYPLRIRSLMEQYPDFIKPVPPKKNVLEWLKQLFHKR